VSIHFFVTFEPHPGMEAAFREALLRVNERSRAEPGCIAMHVYEALRQPTRFAIHSEWVDEAAFETHAQLPHTLHFVEVAEELLTHPIQGLRARHIAGGRGAALIVD
jgi:quinol monooxygenase YgiN